MMSIYPDIIFTGSRILEISDEDLGISFPVLVHYPTKTPSSPTLFGPYTMDVSVNALIAEGQFPLVLISHGNSGSHLIYRSISIYLAQRGYIVAMPEHYGNNRRNNELANSIENLQYRPKHISLTIDQLLSDSLLGRSVLPEKIGVIGHSFGGYTALALAGGIPWTRSGQQVEIQPDSRVKAIVLMAPAAAYFYPEGSLTRVNLPILLLIAQHDEFTPKQWTSDIILKQVPDPSKVTLKTIENAGHFSFSSPFPPAMKNPHFLPSTDPPGFDREEFHRQLPDEILNFLNRSLNPLPIEIKLEYYNPC
ncbi:MAG: alpha/beta fold hydrolase [Saprospiraceae bacterium]|nr:alpha/beta fold hydrolase [Saprospiraceae bacterium]